MRENKGQMLSLMCGTARAPKLRQYSHHVKVEFTIHSKNLQFLIINQFELFLQLEFIKLLKNVLSLIFILLILVLILEKHFISLLSTFRCTLNQFYLHVE